MKTPMAACEAAPQTIVANGNNNCENIYAAIYARTSSPNQKDNYSIDGQLAQCLDYCKKRGWMVSGIFVDECLDAKSIDHRPKFQQMIEKAKGREFNIVVAWKLDRLCRSVADLTSVEQTLRNCGVQLCSVTEFIDSTTSIGRFNLRNLASYSELEREMIGERARLGLYVLAKDQRWPNAIPPLGYIIGSDGRLQIDKKETKTVRFIFRRYLKEKSMPQLAYSLNQQGVRTKTGGKGVWNAHMIRCILTNKIYIGEYNVAGHVEEVERLMIIDRRTFNKVARTMQRFKTGQETAGSMPKNRKKAKVAKVIARYEEFLNAL